jgi:hypothetical protein
MNGGGNKARRRNLVYVRRIPNDEQRGCGHDIANVLCNVEKRGREGCEWVGCSDLVGLESPGALSRGFANVARGDAKQLVKPP